MREAGLVAAAILDEICAAAQARRVDLGARPDRARAGSRSTRSRARSSATPAAVPGGAVHLDQRGHRPRHPAQGRRPRGRRHHRHRLRHLQARVLRRHRADRHGRQGLGRPSASWSRPRARRLEAAIELCRVGNRLGDIGHAVQSLRGITRLFGRPPVRRPRHRPPDARGPAGPELRRRQVVGNA